MKLVHFDVHNATDYGIQSTLHSLMGIIITDINIAFSPNTPQSTYKIPYFKYIIFFYQKKTLKIYILIFITERNFRRPEP